MKKEKKKMSPIVFDMEYNNIMAGGAENQFYSFELVSQAQKIKKAWLKPTQRYGQWTGLRSVKFFIINLQEQK